MALIYCPKCTCYKGEKNLCKKCGYDEKSKRNTYIKNPQYARTLNMKNKKKESQASIWCPKCEFNKNRMEKCPVCGHFEEDTSKTYNINNPKSARTINMPESTSNNICNNPIVIIALVVIAMSVGYMAITKYNERSTINKYMEKMYGTSEINKINDKMLNNMNKANNKMIKDMNKLNNNMMKNINRTYQ